MHSTDDMNDGYLGSGKRLWNSINYHGKENFIKEILEYCDTRDELKRREREIVNEQLLKEDLCMNLKKGGDGGLVDERHRKVFTEAGKQNLVNSKEKREKSLTKTRSTPEYREKMSKALKEFYKTNDGVFTGRQHTEETKRKMSESMKGKGKGESNSQFGTCWITKDGDSKKIKKSDLPNYTTQGWVRGRK